MGSGRGCGLSNYPRQIIAPVTTFGSILGLLWAFFHKEAAMIIGLLVAVVYFIIICILFDYIDHMED